MIGTVFRIYIYMLVTYHNIQTFFYDSLGVANHLTIQVGSPKHPLQVDIWQCHLKIKGFGCFYSSQVI